MSTKTIQENAAVSAEDLLRQLQWRYATKVYDPSRKIDEETWRALEQTLVLTPSSYGLQPWKFFVVTDPAIRAKLRPAAWNQSQVTDASHFVVLARRTDVSSADVDHYIKRIAEVRREPESTLDGFKKMLNNFAAQPREKFNAPEWAGRQVYIALGFLLNSAALLGVDATPMEGFDKAKFDEILGLKEQGYEAVVSAALGYRSTDDKYASTPKVRFATDDVIAYI